MSRSATGRVGPPAAANACWQRHGDFVLMAAELEFAAWDIHGRKLWTMFVESPWTYKIQQEKVLLDVMGQKSQFALASGPAL